MKLRIKSGRNACVRNAIEFKANGFLIVSFMINFAGFYETSLHLKMRTLTIILLVSLALLGHVTAKTKKATKKDIAAYKAEHQKWLDLYKFKPNKETDKTKGVKEQAVPQAPVNAPVQQQAPAQQQANQQNVAPKAKKAKSFEQKKKANSKKKKPE